MNMKMKPPYLISENKLTTEAEVQRLEKKQLIVLKELQKEFGILKKPMQSKALNWEAPFNF